MKRLNWQWNSTFVLVFVPFLIGIFVPCRNLIDRKGTEWSYAVIDDEQIHDTEVNNSPSANVVLLPRMTYDQILAGEDPYVDLELELHLNGQSSACSHTHHFQTSLSKALLEEARQLLAFSEVDTKPTKYDFDLLLTSAILRHLIKVDECGPSEFFNIKNQIDTGTAFLNFCDMGDAHTPHQPDHLHLLSLEDPLTGANAFACHFHTRSGLRITSLEQFASLAVDARHSAKGDASCKVDSKNGLNVCNSYQNSSLEIYAVPAGRVFIFAPKFVGERIELPHIKSPNKQIVSLEVLSVSPRVFEIKNFFSDDEADAIVHKALTETADSHKMKRSSTGATGYNLNSQRTSENAFDTHSKTATEVKKRSFDVLGFDEYHESMADGLQVLRYNVSTAYISHMDWIDDDHHQQEHNYDSAGVGTNRFATVYLYLSDLPEGSGGETAFTEAWPPNQPINERMSLKDALSHIREETNVNDILERGSWQEKLVAQCRTKLAVRPAHAKAILFYSQHPDGEPDNSSVHGACPVLAGTKWGANLWVWNGPRSGYPDAPVNQDVVDRNRRHKDDEAETSGYQQLQAVFSNSGKDPLYKYAELYFQDTFWGKLGHGDPNLGVNTFEGHEWNVMLNGKKVKTWYINKEMHQYYEL